VDDDAQERERELLCAELEHKRRLASKLATRGVAVAVTGPLGAGMLALVAWFIGVPLLAKLGLFYAWTAFVAGTVYAVGNSLARRSAERQLRALDEHRQLPEARIVNR